LFDGHFTPVGKNQLPFCDTGENSDLALLPEVGIHAVLFNRHVEHLGSRGAVDILTIGECFGYPLLVSHPCRHPRLDG